MTGHGKSGSGPRRGAGKSSPRARRGAAKRALSFAGVWAMLAAVWLLLVDTVAVPELAAGAAAALVGAGATELVRAHATAPLRPRARLLAALPRQAARVPLDLALLMRELARALAGRHPGGRMHSLALRAGSGAEANARRAAVELLGSLAPNTIVVGVDEQQAIVHQLAARSSEREAVAGIGR
jgi:multisubunit Na+/H+ antiporter MnhE subunit